MKIKKTERILLDPGYRQIYTPPEAQAPVSKADSRLRQLRRGERVRPRQTRVRLRASGLSEAALLRALAERGIGRPSTYAGIASDLLRRKYARQADGLLVLTPRGQAVQSYLSAAYPQLFALSFSARLEEKLDLLAAGALSYRAVVAEVWNLLEKA